MNKSLPSRAPTLTWVLRILLGIWMLVFGIMKFTSMGQPGMYVDALQSLQNQGLSLIPYNILYILWAWAEVVAWVLLLLWYRTRVWAWLALLVMIVAMIGWWINGMAIGFMLVAGFLIYAGSGSWAMQPTKTCGCAKWCCNNIPWATCNDTACACTHNTN